jgi:hypothetical protein
VKADQERERERFLRCTFLLEDNILVVVDPAFLNIWLALLWTDTRSTVLSQIIQGNSITADYLVRSRNLVAELLDGVSERMAFGWLSSQVLPY